MDRMKVFFSPFSPFVRKVLVCAAELGIDIERVPCAANPVTRDQTVVAVNPLGKVPTTFDDSGDVLYDSRVICEYLDAQGTEPKLFPPIGPARWRSLREQALGDGCAEAILLMRFEQVIRPDGLRHQPWFDGQHEKVVSALDQFEHWVEEFGERVDIGTISIACALAYLDLRFPDEGWRTRRKLAAWFARFAERPSMQSTQHPS
jgi:glutathione S-transferase